MDQLVQASDDIKAKLATLHETEADFPEKQANLLQAKAKLRQAKKARAPDTSDKDLSDLKEAVDQAEVEVAEVCLSVLGARLDVAKARNEAPQQLAELKWERAQAKFDLAKLRKEGERSLNSLQCDIDTWRSTYDKLLGQL